MRRRRQRRERFSLGDLGSLILELWDLIAGVVRVVGRLPLLILRLFD